METFPGHIRELMYGKDWEVKDDGKTGEKRDDEKLPLHH